MAEKKKMRKTGLNIIGDVSWGTHLCVFYQNKEDLIDILVPYFKASSKLIRYSRAGLKKKPRP